MSVVIPTYNEADCIAECVLSLRQQDFTPLDILIVDDGSADETVEICKRLGVRVYSQNHRGPGAARNLGARHASGNILVFVDADMVFAPDYVSRLVAPIIAGEAIAACHWGERVLNWENPWARCRTYYFGLSERQRQPTKPPHAEYVYRAVRMDYFLSSGGYDEQAGRGDDSSIASRTGELATIVSTAVCYHRNPASPMEVIHDAIWAGKDVAVKSQHRLRRCLATLFFANPVLSLCRVLPLTFRTREVLLPLFAALHSSAFAYGILRGLITGHYLK